MKRVLGLLFVLAFIVSCGSGPSKGKTLVKIGGDRITEGDLEFLGEINPRLKMQLNNPMAKKQLLEKLVEQEILYREALKRGLQRKSETKAKIELYRRVIIAQSALEDELGKQSKQYYDKHEGEFKKLELSDIMIRYATPEDIKKQKKMRKSKNKPAWMDRTEKQALKLTKEVKAKIDKGSSFADMAKEYSDDMMSKNKGGSLGPVSKEDKRLEAKGYGSILQKAFELKVGEVFGPIKTDKGYHIITVTKGAQLQPFDDVKSQIEMKLRMKTKNDLIKKLKDEEGVVYVEEEERKEQLEKKRKEAKGKVKIEEKIKVEDGKGKVDVKEEIKIKAEKKSEKLKIKKTEKKTK